MVSKSITLEHDSVAIKDERVSYEECIQNVCQIVEEMDDDECLMLCSSKHKERMLTWTSESHVS